VEEKQEYEPHSDLIKEGESIEGSELDSAHPPEDSNSEDEKIEKDPDAKKND
jgi:hypothetical protein